MSGDSVSGEARTDDIDEKVREYPGKYTLIQNKIANGRALRLVMTVVSGAFWDGDANLIGCGTFKDDDSDMDPDVRGTSVDEVDVLMARVILNQFLKNAGESETF